MKVRVDLEEKVFIPFKFTVEIETKEEAVKFMILLYHAKITDALNLGKDFVALRTLLNKQASIKYEDYQDLFRKLDNIIKK